AWSHSAVPYFFSANGISPVLAVLLAEVWTEFLLSFAGDNLRFVEVLVFVLGLAESIALVSLFVPSTILFLGIGAVHSAAGGEFWPVWMAGATGAWVGDCISYGLEIGRAHV